MDFNKKNKPKLVEGKILKKTIKKQKLVIEEKNKYKNMLSEYLKENYGIILLFLALMYLLYMRYREVKKRKNIDKSQNNINEQQSHNPLNNMV